MAGGKSSRMGMDKACIEIDGIPQYNRAEKLLSQFCESVYISCRTDAAYRGHLIYDLPETAGGGPAAGLLAAFAHTDIAWMVLGVDYPILTPQALDLLLCERDTGALATVYMNAHGFYEPLIGIYEPAFRQVLIHETQMGNMSLQSILKTVACKGISAPCMDEFKSFDSPEDYKNLI